VIGQDGTSLLPFWPVHSRSRKGTAGLKSCKGLAGQRPSNGDRACSLSVLVVEQGGQKSGEDIFRSVPLLNAAATFSVTAGGRGIQGFCCHPRAIVSLPSPIDARHHLSGQQRLGKSLHFGRPTGKFFCVIPSPLPIRRFPNHARSTPQPWCPRTRGPRLSPRTTGPNTPLLSRSLTPRTRSKKEAPAHRERRGR
jgi:hypothetical protein